jgi:hypothetical protein
MGIRNNWQKGLSAEEVAKRNFNYARECLNYLGCREYQNMMSEIQFKYSWEDLAYMKTSYKPKIQKLGAICEKLPFTLELIRLFHQRVLFLQK